MFIIHYNKEIKTINREIIEKTRENAKGKIITYNDVVISESAEIKPFAHQCNTQTDVDKWLPVIKEAYSQFGEPTVEETGEIPPKTEIEILKETVDTLVLSMLAE